jgi:hypothetical protein
MILGLVRTDSLEVVSLMSLSFVRSPAHASGLLH